MFIQTSPRSRTKAKAEKVCGKQRRTRAGRGQKDKRKAKALVSGVAFCAINRKKKVCGLPLMVEENKEIYSSSGSGSGQKSFLGESATPQVNQQGYLLVHKPNYYVLSFVSSSKGMLV